LADRQQVNATPRDSAQRSRPARLVIVTLLDLNSGQVGHSGLRDAEVDDRRSMRIDLGVAVSRRLSGGLQCRSARPHGALGPTPEAHAAGASIE
jgi:hypothetical protein